MGRGKRGRRKRGTEGKKSGVPPNCSSYPQEIDTEFDWKKTICAGDRQNMPCPCKLTFDLLT